MSENVIVSQGIFFFNQRKLPSYIKTLNTKCHIKNLKGERHKSVLAIRKFVKGREV